MAISMYEASVPVFRHVLCNLSSILDKAAVQAATKGLEPDALLRARLFPDMLPMWRQVQIAADFAKGASARLAGVAVPEFEHTEQDFAELTLRIGRTVAFIGALDPKAIDGSEARDIAVMAGREAQRFTGRTYLLYYALPNFYFHVTTAYSILRHNGVDLGKRDYDSFHRY